jgi:Flp pilus assembly pilin Flp
LTFLLFVQHYSGTATTTYKNKSKLTSPKGAALVEYSTIVATIACVALLAIAAVGYAIPKSFCGLMEYFDGNYTWNTSEHKCEIGSSWG